MRKNTVRSVVVHIADNADIHALANRVNGFHVDLIERKLNQSGLSTEQKIAVIDKILDDMKSRDVDGTIK